MEQSQWSLFLKEFPCTAWTGHLTAANFNFLIYERVNTIFSQNCYEDKIKSMPQLSIIIILQSTRIALVHSCIQGCVLVTVNRKVNKTGL